MVGISRSLRPTRRCEGVSGSSKSSVDRYVRGRELRTASTSTKAVVSSSRESLARPIDFLKQRFTALTMRSKTPPHHGALGRLNVHWTPMPAKYDFTSGWLTIAFIWLAAASKVRPLSDNIRCGIPRLAMNLFMHRRKASVVRSGTTSKCTALTIQHVNKHTHAYLVTAVAGLQIAVQRSLHQCVQMAGLPWLLVWVAVVVEVSHMAFLHVSCR